MAPTTIQRRIKTFQPRVQGCILSIAVSPNGRHCVSLHCLEAFRKYAINVWHVESGTCLRTRYLRHNCHGLPLVAALDDNESFLCGCRNRILHYNILTGERIRTFETISDHLYWLGKYDSTRFVTIENLGELGRVYLRHIESGVSHGRTIMMRFADITCLEKIANNKILLIRSLMDSMEAIIFNADTGQNEKYWFLDEGRVDKIAVVDNDTFLGVREYGQEPEDEFLPGLGIAVMEIDTGEELSNFGRVRSINSNLALIGGTNVLCGTDHCNICMYDIKSGKCTMVFEDLNQSVTHIAPLDSTRFLSGSSYGSLELWDYSHWQVVKHLILLRQLVSHGRATLLRRSKRSRFHKSMCCPDSVLQQIICNAPDEIFRKVVSYVDS